MTDLYDDDEPEPCRRKPATTRRPRDYRGLSLQERFTLRVTPRPEHAPCILWTGGRNGDGAPQMRDEAGRVRPAQHIALALADRPNPKPSPPHPPRTLVVRTNCKTPWCMYPGHIEWISPDWKDYRP